MSAAIFDPLRILKTLDRHEVKFVIIGGIAGRLWGSTSLADVLHICYARDDANREALAAALRDLKATVPDARKLKAGDAFTFTTSAGNFDIIGMPAGSTGYEGLARTAARMDVGGLDVLVAALEDLILMKRAAGRPKDLIEIEILAAVREELDR
jgi:hypothetical protein